MLMYRKQQPKLVCLPSHTITGQELQLSKILKETVVNMAGSFNGCRFKLSHPSLIGQLKTINCSAIDVCHLMAIITQPHSPLPSFSSLCRVSVLTWAVPIWRVWAENFARHSTSPPWRSESAAPRGTTLPRNPPDCQHTRNCWLFQRPPPPYLPGILRSPWPDCPAVSQPIRKTFAFHFLLEQPITNSSPEWGKLIGWLLDSLSIFFFLFLFF